MQASIGCWLPNCTTVLIHTRGVTKRRGNAQLLDFGRVFLSFCRIYGLHFSEARNLIIAFRNGRTDRS